MPDVGIGTLLVDKDVDARAEIARRVGERLSVDDLPEVERRAAEALARTLVEDAIERVRCELSEALKSARHVSRDVALKIAHDVDKVSCPFLEVTEIFSEEDWQQLVLTISRGARISVARRKSMSEALAVSLAEIGDTLVAQTLVENPAAPMTPPVCTPIMERFEASTWVLDKMAERDDLYVEVASRLIGKVSAAARHKLKETYDVHEEAEEMLVEVERSALVKLICQAPEARMPSLAKQIYANGQLTFELMLHALQGGSLGFFEAALAILSKMSGETIATIVERGSDGHLTALLSKVGVPRDIYAELWEELQKVRKPQVRAFR
jgi:uncharacterized protein (DUF2336 family)